MKYINIISGQILNTKYLCNPASIGMHKHVECYFDKRQDSHVQIELLASICIKARQLTCMYACASALSWK